MFFCRLSAFPFLDPSSVPLPLALNHLEERKSDKNLTTMAATPDADVGEEEILSYKPLGENSAVSANPHIPSVTASAVLGESESVRKS